MVDVPDPYGRGTLHGKPLDNATIAAVRKAERILGYELTILQGIGGADASAGTHTEGRAVDLSAIRADEKLPVFKRIGFAIYERDDLPGVWAKHLHGILIFEDRDNSRGLNDVGFRQIASYDAKRDGLSGNGPDPNPWRPDPPAVFTREEYREAWVNQNRPPKTKVTRARNRLTEAIEAVAQAAALLDDVDPSRIVARSQLDDLRAEKRHLLGILDNLPPR